MTTRYIDAITSNLRLDTENPRIAEGVDNQVDAIQAMLRAEGQKTLALAQSIAKEGLSPIERLLVLPIPDDPKKFIVVEGNRRITALKILGEPSLAEPVFSAAQMRSLRQAAAAFQEASGAYAVPCAVVGSRDEANVWIERRHRGDQGGLGIVRWGATESARFDERRTGRQSPELQVLDFVAEHGTLDEAVRDGLHDLPITNLKRLLRDAKVRKALGITIEDGQVKRLFPQDDVLRGLSRIIRDLALDKIKVADIYSAPDRSAYVGGFRRSERPDPKKKLPSAQVLAAGETPQAESGRRARGARTPRARQVLIPSSCSCEVRGAKLKNIFVELRRLTLEDFANAVSVLFRVFVELSVDELLSRERLMQNEQQRRNSKLRHKVTAAVVHLKEKGRLTADQATAAARVVNDQIIAGSIQTLHDYVHSRHHAASPTDLRTAWDNLEPLMEAIWPQRGR
jgi:hypothetical protein